MTSPDKVMRAPLSDMAAMQEHRRLVCGLYRRALRTSLDWIVDRQEWRRFAVSVRARFDEARGLADGEQADRAVRATQLLLHRYRHPEPYKCGPLGAGGC